VSKVITVKLGDTEYSVPKLNIGQLREVSRIITGDRAEVSFEVLGVALRRADPKVDDVNMIEAEVDEIGKAVTDILAFAGFKKEAADPNLPSPAPRAG
jgi:hypothetical protein